MTRAGITASDRHLALLTVGRMRREKGEREDKEKAIYTKKMHSEFYVMAYR